MTNPDQTLDKSNPLLNFDGLPHFHAFTPAHVEPAIDKLLVLSNDCLEKTVNSTNNSPTVWEETILPLDNMLEHLNRAWGIVSHLHAVSDSEPLRAAYNKCLPKITDFWSKISQDERLYSLYRTLSKSEEAKNYTKARQKVLENALRSFKLGGAELPAEQKQRFLEIQERKAAISSKFSQNVLDATNKYECIINDESELSGLPDYAKETAKELAEEDGKSGYKFTLQFPSYFPVLQYCENRKLRETLYEAYAKRASEYGPAEFDNSTLMTNLLKFRHEAATMLGYRHYADLSLVPKMAETPEDVITFLHELAEKARPFAEKDIEELRQFAKEELSLETLQSWDFSFAAEKLKQKKFDFSDLEVRRYFNEDKVLGGLFSLTERLFGVTIKQTEAETWHEDVRYFEVIRDNQVIASFFLDPYSRENKRSGAWMDDARGRKSFKNSVQTPIAYLTCNYTKPAKGKPAQLSHDDVLTLFHEFGHGVHHMLTEVDELDVAGINGVEWDAVELPSQFMENFAWEWSVVESLTEDEETKQPMPKELFDKMVAAKNFHSGQMTLRQIEFSLFDMLLHSTFNPNDEEGILDLLNQVRQEIAVFMPPEYNRFPHSFTHIFAGGYAAGYYSYKWAEVLSADAFACFEENGVNNPETGQKFLKEILAVGGSRPAAESFKAFRGRPPKIDALLRHTGMTNDSKAA